MAVRYEPFYWNLSLTSDWHFHSAVPPNAGTYEFLDYQAQTLWLPRSQNQIRFGIGVLQTSLSLQARTEDFDDLFLPCRFSTAGLNMKTSFCSSFTGVWHCEIPKNRNHCRSSVPSFWNYRSAFLAGPFRCFKQCNSDKFDDTLSRRKTLEFRYALQTTIACGNDTDQETFVCTTFPTLEEFLDRARRKRKKSWKRIFAMLVFKVAFFLWPPKKISANRNGFSWQDLIDTRFVKALRSKCNLQSLFSECYVFSHYTMQRHTTSSPHNPLKKTNKSPSVVLATFQMLLLHDWRTAPCTEVPHTILSQLMLGICHTYHDQCFVRQPSPVTHLATANKTTHVSGCTIHCKHFATDTDQKYNFAMILSHAFTTLSVAGLLQEVWVCGLQVALAIRSIALPLQPWMTNPVAKNICSMHAHRQLRANKQLCQYRRSARHTLSKGRASDRKEACWLYMINRSNWACESKIPTSGELGW